MVPCISKMFYEFALTIYFFIKCSLIMFSKTLALLDFASRILPQCRMLHVLKSEVFIHGCGGGCGGLGPLNFLNLPLSWSSRLERHIVWGVPLQVDQLRQAVRNLKSEQNRLTGELEREREDRARLV